MEETSGLKCGFWISLFLGCLLFACQDDSHEEQPFPNEETENTSFAKIDISEVQVGDAPAVTWQQSYHYDESDRLVSVVTVQTFTAIEAHEMREEMTLVYSEDQVCVVDDVGNRWTYHLDKNSGKAISCLYQSAGGSMRIYQFSYALMPNGKHGLSQVIEKIEGEDTDFCSLSIDYVSTDVSIVTKEIHGIRQDFELRYFTGSHPENVVQLPPLFLSELYPLSQHTVAMYAHLLGDYHPNLLQSVTPQENVYREVCTYAYKMEQNYPVNCEIRTVSQGEEYVRKLTFHFEERLMKAE